MFALYKTKSLNLQCNIDSLYNNITFYIIYFISIGIEKYD